MLFQDDDDDDDSMFPPQYALRRDHRPGHGQNTWPSGYDEESHGHDVPEIVNVKAPLLKIEHGHKRRTSHFLPAPGNKSSEYRGTYSWTFFLRGRRLRMTIRSPELPSLETLRIFVGDIWNWRGVGMRRRGLLWGMVGDGVSVAWPAVIVWGVIVRWIF